MKGTAWIFGLMAASIWGLTCTVSPPLKMVVIAFWIFYVLKFHVWRNFAGRNGTDPTAVMASQWFLLTPTLDANRFFGMSLSTSQRPTRWQWLFAVAKTLVGAILFFGVAAQCVDRQVMVAGWIAMTGIAMMLHFGLLEVIVLWWRFQGRDLRPLMQQPLQTSSLSDFWGRRWNTGFHDFAYESIFRPVCRRWNAQIATASSFVFSGLIHELAISVPAGDGYGLPFAYFVIQWFGVTLERALSKRGWPARSGILGWLFAAVFLIAPAGLLFHAGFVRSVIVPLIPSM